MIVFQAKSFSNFISKKFQIYLSRNSLHVIICTSIFSLLYLPYNY